MIVTILMFLIAIGLMAGVTKVAQYRALGPDGRRAKKLQQLESRRKHALSRAAKSGSNAAECIAWTGYAAVAEHQIENLRAEGKVKELESGLAALQAKVAEINPEATPLELELGIGPSAGSKLAQETIDRLDLALKEEQNRIMAAELAVSLAARKHRAEQGLCCKFCYGEDHKAEDCIENPATLNESLARQEHLWSDRDHQARLAREDDLIQTYTWGQAEPIGEYRIGTGRRRPIDLHPYLNAGLVSKEYVVEQQEKVLNDLLDHLKGLSDEH